MPNWLVEEYPHMRAVHPDKQYEEELPEETEKAVRALLEEFVGMESEAIQYCGHHSLYGPDCLW